MHLRDLLLCSAFFVSVISAQEESQLPADSADLVNRLAAYEKVQRAALDKQIREKSDAVIATLEKHLVRETKAGRLDSAVALKKQIEALSKAAPKIAEQAPGLTTQAPKRLTKSEREALGKRFSGRWEGFEERNNYFSLNSENRTMYYQAAKWGYEIGDDGVMTVTDDDGKQARFQLDQSGEEITGTDFSGKRVKLGRWGR